VTEERTSIRAEIDAIDQELDETNEEVDQLSARLFVLKRNRSRPHDKRVHLLHRLGPVSLVLPSEILSEGFELVTITKKA
jgi:chromosome segregation ATPase